MEPSRDFSENFIRNLLLNLEYSDYDQYMDLFYYVIIQNTKEILENEDLVKDKVEVFDTLINYFEETEEYEKCTNLQKLKYMLYVNTSEVDDDLNNQSFLVYKIKTTMAILTFIFQSFWHFAGTVFLLSLLAQWRPFNITRKKISNKQLSKLMESFHKNEDKH